MGDDTERFNVGGVIFLLIVFAAYLVVFYFNYSKMDPNAERLVVLNTRTALFLPCYSLMMFISLVAPVSNPVMAIPEAIVEGYSFYCFLVLMITNMGGPAATVAYMKETGRDLICCTNICPKDPAAYYKKTVWAMFHFVVTRPIVIILSAICAYAGSKAGKLLYLAFSVLGIAMLAYSLLHFVLLYENIYARNTNLNGIVKVFLLKFSVGLIVLQGLVVEAMVATDKEPFNDDSHWNKEDKTTRAYSVLVMLEFVILTLPYTIVYSMKISPSAAVTNAASSSAPSSPTLGHFICQILRFQDIFGYLTYTDSMEQPLSKA